MDELQNTKSKPRAAYRMVDLLPLGGDTYRRFVLPVRFRYLKSAKNSKTLGARRGISAEDE